MKTCLLHFFVLAFDSTVFFVACSVSEFDCVLVLVVDPFLCSRYMLQMGTGCLTGQLTLHKQLLLLLESRFAAT